MNNITSRENQTAPGPLSRTNVTAIAELVPIASVIVIMNTLVFVVFLNSEKLRTPANMILFSLAITDFLTGALNIPMLIMVVFTPLIASNTVRFHLGYLLPVIHTVTAILSVYHIVFATLEKYLSIIWPITHRLVKRETVIKVLMMVWLFAFVIGFIPFAWINKIPSALGMKYVIGYVACCFVVVFLVPYIIMVYAFFKMFRAIARGAGQNGTSRTRKKLKRKIARERKCATLFFSMALLFVICWFPWFLLQLLIPLNLKSLRVPAHVFAIVRYVTSFINPMLYSLMRPDFKQAVKNLVRRMRLPRVLTFRFSCLGKDKGKKNLDGDVDPDCSSPFEQLYNLSNQPEGSMKNEDPSTVEIQLGD